MAAGAVTLYNDAMERIFKPTSGYNLASDTFKALLCTSSYTPSAAHSVLADITNEHGATGGYGRITLTTVTVTETSGSVTMDSDDIDFGAAVTLTAKYLVVFDDTHASDGLLFYVDLNSGGGSVSSTASSFKITINASGIFVATKTP